MSVAVLLDTDVFSFLANNDTRVTRAELVGASERAISFKTVAELRAWTILRSWSAKRSAQLEWIVAAHLVLIPDDHTTSIWAQIHAERRRKERLIECGDCWIAATAVRHGLVLVTHTKSHYEGIEHLSMMAES